MLGIALNITVCFSTVCLLLWLSLSNCQCHCYTGDRSGKAGWSVNRKKGSFLTWLHAEKNIFRCMIMKMSSCSVHSWRACAGSYSVPSLIHSPLITALDGGWVVSIRPRLLYPREGAVVPTENEAQKRSGRFWKKENILPVAGVKRRTVQSAA